MSKKRLLIIFPDEWLSHSPTLLNLVTGVSSDFNIKLVTFDDGFFKNDHLRDNRFKFIKINQHLARLFLRRIRIFYDVLKAIILLIWLANYRKRDKIDLVIAVDSVGLWAAQKVFTRCHFLSMEIKKNIFFRLSRSDRIDSLAIQTAERSAFLFRRPLANTFLIPNSPVIDKSNPSNSPGRSFNGKIIFFGNIHPNHGLYTCLDTIEQYQRKFKDEGISLTIKGIITKPSILNRILKRYQRLLDEKLIFLDETYESQDQIIAYLAKFSIGICFYDFNLISRKDFNYLSCPSGKLFNYFAAGVPVIGTDILGLKPVKDHRAGVLLKDLTVESIQQAIEDVSRNFAEYRKNAFSAAEAYDFNNALISYKNFLLSQ